jgi:hypothetical protein
MMLYSSHSSRFHFLFGSTNTQQVLESPEPLRNLAELVAAQMEFHKKAHEILSELAPIIDGLQVEQEASRASAFSLH